MTKNQTMIEQVYLQANEVSRGFRQTVGKKNDLYITLEQLMMILEKFKSLPMT